MAPSRSAFRRANFKLLDDIKDETAAIRCVADLVEFNAIHNPEHVFCIQSRQRLSGKEFEFVCITYHELAGAVERCCEWILSNIPGAHAAVPAKTGIARKSKPVALYLESDVGLFIHLVALLALNIPCLLLSIRLNAGAVRHLLSETSTSSIIVSTRTGPSAENALADISNIGIITASGYTQQLRSDATFDPSNAWISRCRQAVCERDRNVIILHSSGTTGLPKPIPLAHRYLLGYAACHLFQEDDDKSIGHLNLSTLPLFHGFGLLAPCLSLSVGLTLCLPPPSTIPNGNLVVSLLQSKKFTSLMTVPKILEDITLSDRYEDAARNLSLLDFVAVGGGGIKTSVGEDLRGKGVRLLNHYGATEIGALAPIFQPEDGYDWTYLRLRRDIGLTLVTADSDGINPLSCELVGHPFGWDSEFRLQDRLERNPKRPDSEVKVLGRNDDVIVLATGEKVSPHLFERILEANPEIRRAIMFGNGQFECGVLIEPISPVHDSTDDFIESIWPSVVQANALVDSHARIPTRAALVVKPANKDIPLSDKGFPQRGQVYSTFAPEIDHMYNNLLGVQFDDQTMALNPNSMESSLRKMVQMCLPDHIKNGTWSDDEDFIHLGMDSLQATRLRRMLIASLRHSQNLKIENRDLPLDIVYTYPSITRLSRALKQKPGENESGPNCVQEMDTLARKYAIEVKTSNGSRQHGSTILLTGTTGNLGAHLLQHLAESPKVQRLFCLLRRHPTPSPESQADTSEDRQLTALHSRRIELSPVARGKIEFMSWTPGAGLLGLSDAEYQLLVGNVTHIFHGAWPMDFKRKLSSFEPHIKALRDLIDLAQAIYFAQPQIRPKIIFASSIAVAGRHDSMQSSGKVQETPLADPNDPLPMGYAQAKWVCEKMISMVSSYLCTEAGPKVEPIIIRIGQLSGSRLTGFWSPREHIPALVKASQDIGAMPDVSGTLSWLPVDQAARVVSELILGPTAGQLVYHVENPVRQKWRDVLTIIERKLGLSSSKRMPFQEWLSQISKGKDAPESLFEFYRNHFLQMSTGVVVLDTQACRSSSPTMRSTGGVKVETIELYIDFWKSSGLLKEGPADRLFLYAGPGAECVSRLNRIARMERTRRSLTDAANLLSITDLLNRSIRTVIDEWAKESVGLPGTNGSPKILPSHELHQAQRTILAICGTLTELVAEPASRVIEVACGYWESRALYIAAERRIPDLLSRAGEGGMSAKELGKVTGIESAKLGGCFSLTERGRGCLFRNMWLMHPGSRTARTLRCLCSIHFFREVAPDCFANNSISQSLVGNEPLRAYVLLFNLDLYTASDHLPKYLLGAKGHSYKVEETAFQEAVGTSKPRWDWLEEKQPVQELCTTGPGYPGMPGLQKTLEGAGATKKDVVPRPEHEVFGLAMLGGGLVFGAAHPYGQFVEEVLRLSDAEVHADYPWDGLGEATVVDVGGGVGGFAIQLSRLYPKLKFVIQDRAPVLEQAEHVIWPKENPAALTEGRVTFMPHDFFESNPVKGAEIYWLRYILHDWSNAYCIRILSSLRSAMISSPNSRILICDQVMNTTLGCAELESAPQPLPANYGYYTRYSHQRDLAMMGIINGIERTPREWKALVEEAGLRVERIWECRSQVSIVEVRAALVNGVDEGFQINRDI